ncbi:MAG: NADH-quinone oxidoreductase subunit L [Candidatus Omnitrophota bacterium]
MHGEQLLLIIIFTPLLGAFILPLCARISPYFRNSLALIFSLTSFISSLFVIPRVLNGQALVISKALPLGFNILFCADALAVFMAATSSLISSVIVFYSFGYISHYQEQDEYYLMVLLFLGAMMGLVFSGNLILLYVFWEITAIASWRLIGFFREKNHILRADKAFLVTVAGALVMLIGFLMLYQQTGSFDIPVIKAALGGNAVSGIAALLIIIGIFSKSATLPFHTWLPDAGVAPSPVTALLHAAVLVKIGVYVFARLFVADFILAEYLKSMVLWVAAASALISAGAALLDTDLKRIIAYSTISQIGFIFLGLALGTEIAVAGAMLYILMHGLAKAGLFLCAGIIEQNTGSKDITKLGGLVHTMPLTAVSFLFCAFSVMGIPPFGGFLAKLMVITAAFSAGRLIIAFVFVACAGMTILYLFRVFNLVFMGEGKGILARESSLPMIASVLALAVLSLAGGIFIKYPNSFIQVAAQQMLAIAK